MELGKKKGGFTYIEVIVSLVILAVVSLFNTQVALFVNGDMSTVKSMAMLSANSINEIEALSEKIKNGDEILYYYEKKENDVTSKIQVEMTKVYEKKMYLITIDASFHGEHLKSTCVLMEMEMSKAGEERV